MRQYILWFDLQEWNWARRASWWGGVGQRGMSWCASTLTWILVAAHQKFLALNLCFPLTKWSIPMRLCSLVPRFASSFCVNLGLRRVSLWPLTYSSSSSSGLHFLLTVLLLWTWHLGGRRSTSSHTYGHYNQLCSSTEMNTQYFSHVTYRMLASFPGWL